MKKEYLGEFSQQLPSSALRFPLSLKLAGEEDSVVRTILNINEEDNTMVFAGDMPEGASARLMKANFDHLVDKDNQKIPQEELLSNLLKTWKVFKKINNRR